VKIKLLLGLVVIAALLGVGYWYYRKHILPKTASAAPTVPSFDETPAPNRPDQVQASDTETSPEATAGSTEYESAFGPDANQPSNELIW
jgi:hypothetical protein